MIRRLLENYRPSRIDVIRKAGLRFQNRADVVELVDTLS